ncbi:hypothetical protein HWV62_32618 [Athelia sp. TMB]|nr:hypothetical protein HWV62_32618 [Athelia sp. TMB]
MATATPRPAPNPSATPGPASTRPRDLSSLRPTDGGSAFRGPPKGRGGGSDRGGGRGGRRSGRSGRGPDGRARAGTEPNTPKVVPLPLRVEIPGETKPSPARAASSSPTAGKSTGTASAAEKLVKSKAPSRRGSRNVPAVVVAPSSPTVESSPTSGRPKNPRKRAQQGKGATNATRQTLTIDSAMSQTASRPQKARTGPPTPTIVKDIPPHLAAASAAPEVSTFDMKHDIDALVERMRSHAMSDSLRPSTPGSHIDWAGDDDDSLPDLNDWGVSPSIYQTAVEEMSPILVDDLKPLPEAVTRIKVEAAAEAAALPVAPQEDDKRLPSSETAPAPSTPAVSSQPTKATLHPSLPSKPSANIPNSSERSKSKAVPVPVHVAAPTVQPVTQADKPGVNLGPSAATAEEVSLSANQLPELAVVRLPASATSETVAVVTASDPTEVEFAVEKSSGNNGLSASIHAPSGPSPSSDSTSLPSLSSANLLTTATPTGPRSFQPSHQRAHTVGRPPPTSPPAHQRFPRAGGGSSRGGSHNRTHSSPPVVTGSSPRPRPVLTAAAISRVMKNIPKAQGIAAATE